MTISGWIRRRARLRSLRGGGTGGRFSSGARRYLMLAALVLGGGAALIGGGGLVFAAVKYHEYSQTVVPPDQLLANLPRGGAHIYDRNGKLLYEFVDEFSGLRRPVALQEVSPYLQQATIATEDSTFWENNGLNTKGLIRAALENFSPIKGDLFGGSGGSSITQQLAKNVYIPKDQRATRSVDRKLREAVIAVQLTRKYPKPQILEWYLSSISYGGIYVGIEAASEGYFGKHAKDLTLSEAALLAGLPQAPSRYDPFQHPNEAQARQHEVLSLMVRHGAITQEQAEQAKREPLAFKHDRFDIEAPHFVLGRIASEIEKRYGPRAIYENGLEITTTLDLDLQHAAEQTIEKWVSEFEEQAHGHNGALYALDPRSGEILAYVGSRDYFRDDILGRNDNIVGLNSPGSTLKPFTYMNAFTKGWSTGTGIIDSPAEVMDPSTGRFFAPRNPAGDFQGVISAADALGNSLNIPAFRTIMFGGVEDTVRLLKQAGITTLDSPLGYGPALTLGGADITLEDLTYAYSVLAAQGAMHGQKALTAHRPGERQLDPVAIRKITDHTGKVLYEFKQPEERRVIGANFTYLVTSILSDPKTTCITFSCAGLGLPDRPSAQKTGTSEPYENSRAIGDTWTFGYTPDLVAGVWAGNSDNSPMQNIVSTSISWRAWHDFMVAADAQLKLPVKPFPRPDGVVERDLCWPSGKLLTPLCPEVKRYKGLFASDALPKDAEKDDKFRDTWWQEVPLDTRTGQRATSSTPAEFIRKEVRLVLPKEEIKGWPGLREWAISVGLGAALAPPEEIDALSGQLVITSPAPKQKVSGQVTVQGAAASAQLQSFSLDWGRGATPTSWVQLRASTVAQQQGTLATWDTTTLPNSTYTLRLRLSDAQLGERTYFTTVTVDNGTLAPTTDAAPAIVISDPTGAATVDQTVTIRGTATSGALIDYYIEVGTGLAPTSWTVIGRGTTSVVNAALGNWDTTDSPNGVYTIRITVRDRVFGSASVTQQVAVRHVKR